MESKNRDRFPPLRY